jgi:uncharacterized membrane protein YkvA (DUF1232 family)
MNIRTRGAVPRFEEQERDVRRDFWTTLKRLAGQVPFVEDLVAAYYCALDPATPMRVRGILLAALAYFIVRWRYRPLTWLWRFPGLGFTDDAAVLTALFGLSSHITPVHRAAAARAEPGLPPASKARGPLGREASPLGLFTDLPVAFFRA